MPDMQRCYIPKRHFGVIRCSLRLGMDRKPKTSTIKIEDESIETEIGMYYSQLFVSGGLG